MPESVCRQPQHAAGGRTVLKKLELRRVAAVSSTVNPISPACVKREWSLAKGWLYRGLTGGAPAA